MAPVKLERFPALPASVTELLKLRPRDAAYFEGVLDVCQSDAGMASEVLRLSQSVAVAPSVRIRSVREALLHVGPRPAVNHLLGGAMVRVFVPQGALVRGLWQRCVWTAVASQHLVLTHTAPALDPHVAHAVGLLHDLGQLAMACAGQQEYRMLLDKHGRHAEALIQAERRLFGESHATLGARFAEEWGFTDLIRYVIANHHTQELQEGPTFARRFTRLVAFVDALHASRTGGVPAAEVAVERAADMGLRLDEGDLPALRARIDDLAEPDILRLGLFSEDDDEEPDSGTA